MSQFVTFDSTWFLFVALLWILPWKGFALWKSAKKNDKWWFVVLLIVNTFGLLEIVYLFFWKRGRKVHTEKNEGNEAVL